MSGSTSNQAICDVNKRSCDYLYNGTRGCEVCGSSGYENPPNSVLLLVVLRKKCVTFVAIMLTYCMKYHVVI
jgi:hypothetical protein